MTATVLYVAGAGRSGSTLVSRYFEERSNAVHVGEVRYIFDRGVLGNQLCECGVPFNACEFWTTAFDIAYGMDPQPVATESEQIRARVDRLRFIARLRSQKMRDDVTRYRELLRPLYEALRKITGTNLLIDSSKDPSYLYCLNAAECAEVTALHLVRDSRAVAYSWTRQRRRPEIHWEEAYMRVLPVRRSALQWSINNGLVSAYCRSNPSLNRLRYEDFADNPELASGSQRAWLEEIAPVDSKIDGRGHSFSGNPMRFERQPMEIRPDDEWRSALSPRDRLLVTAVTAPLLRTYGYDIWV